MVNGVTAIDQVLVVGGGIGRVAAAYMLARREVCVACS
jgi:glycine/D-amino acid oxidase-like deaminating enzyme